MSLDRKRRVRECGLRAYFDRRFDDRCRRLDRVAQTMPKGIDRERLSLTQRAAQGARRFGERVDFRAINAGVEISGSHVRPPSIRD
jgi:hypothetical protein